MFTVGVDLGGTEIKVGLVCNGEIVFNKSQPTNATRDNLEILESIRDLVFDVIKGGNATLSEIKYVGVGTPGSVDADNGIVLSAYNLGFFNLKMREILMQMINLPVFVENDANCAGVAEYYAGNAKGYKDALLLTIGTGLGGGLVLDGKVISGAYSSGGEFGHMVLSVDGRDCTCGRKGCFEAYCSATAIIKQCVRKAKENPDSMLYKIVDGDMSLLNPKVLYEAKELGCEVAIDIVNEFNLYLAEGIANLINIFEPEIVLLGGGISKQGENLLADVRPLALSKCFDKKSKVLIQTAKFFNDAGIIGASYLGENKIV